MQIIFHNEIIKRDINPLLKRLIHSLPKLGLDLAVVRIKSGHEDSIKFVLGIDPKMSGMVSTPAKNAVGRILPLFFCVFQEVKAEPKGITFAGVSIAGYTLQLIA